MDKKTLSEADICEKFITPAIQQAGWNTVEQIYREYTLRPGRVVVRGNHAARDKKSVLRADYVLFYKTNIPLVVVEAKDNSYAVGAGMAQAINYAALLNIPFAISSNGDGCMTDTGQKRTLRCWAWRRSPMACMDGRPKARPGQQRVITS